MHRAILAMVAWCIPHAVSFAASKDANAPAPPEANWPGFADLFNGKDLAGWKPNNKDATWFVESGCLVGTQTSGKGGDLFSEKGYDNFELRVLYRVAWPANTGFWFRWDGKAGYQFDVLEYKRPEAYTGTLYCHGKMFLARNLNKALEDRAGWNVARVWANGEHIIMGLNGYKVADVKDKTFAKGQFGMQVHGGNDFKGMKVIVKRFAIRPLTAEDKAPTDLKEPPPRPEVAMEGRGSAGGSAER